MRLPITIGSEKASLLLPLYAVVTMLALSLAWQLLRGDPRTRELGPVAWPLAAVVFWTGLSLAWTLDPKKGSIFLAAFILPFGLLAIGFARLPWRGRWLTWLWGGLVLTALAYATVGMYQWVTRDVFWNPGIIVGNAYAPFFRVNSVFWDPSIYGRYLAVAILVTLAGIVLGGVRGLRSLGAVRRRRRDLDRARLLVLAVELHRARSRRRRLGRGRLGAPRRGRARRARPARRPSSRSRRRSCATRSPASRAAG